MDKSNFDYEFDAIRIVEIRVWSSPNGPPNVASVLRTMQHTNFSESFLPRLATKFVFLMSMKFLCYVL